MSVTADMVLEHLQEQSDLLAAVIESELSSPIELKTSRLAVTKERPKLDANALGLRVSCEETAIALVLSPGLVPEDWSNRGDVPKDAAERFTAALLPEEVIYDQAQFTDVAEITEAITDRTKVLTVPVADSSERLIVLVGLKNAAAEQRVGDGRLRNLPVNVVVTLAEKRIDVGQLLAITPGSLITFNKPCEDLLDLYVNNHLHARGEAVKIGENFGLKVNRIGVVEKRISPVLTPVRG